MDDLQLLLTRCRETPADTALLSAYADCLIEQGHYATADVVKSLIEIERQKPVHNVNSAHTRLLLERDRLRFVLGFRDVHVGDFLAVDGDGKVFPVIDYSPAVVGQAFTKLDGAVVLSVGMYAMRVETSKGYK